MSRPPIGVPRCYPGPGLPVLYPGERATAQFEFENFFDAVTTGRDVQVLNWLVEPVPGWYGWYLRTRWRLFGRWGTLTRPAKLEARLIPRGGRDV